jgi:hypothetical protein
MLHVAVLGARLEPVLRNPAAQWDLAQQFYGTRPELLERYGNFRRGHPNSGIFSPQPLTLLMRLLIDHARNEPIRDLDSTEFAVLQDAVLGAHSALETALDALGFPSPEHVLAYELQAATFFRRPQFLEEMARHREFRRLAVDDERLSGSSNRVPVDEWLTASGVSPDDQWALGFGLSAMTHAFTDAIRPRGLREHVDDLVKKLGLQSNPRELPVIAASREELRSRFGELGGGDETLAWELRPFKETPFLRLVGGDLVLLAPPWLLSWLGEGFHYRALTYAQKIEGSEASAKYTRFAGEVVERYALDLAEAAIPPPARVLPEQRYGKGGGKRTSDIAVIWGHDVILFETHARRVAANAAVVGDARDATLEVSRLLVEKIDQVGQCIGALLTGDAELPDVTFGQVKRVWPVVVSVGHLMQTQHLWEYVRGARDTAKTAPLDEPQVQPVQILDMEDFEKLMALVEAGEELPVLLARKTGGAFRDRDFAAWLHGDRHAPSDKPRLSVLKERWDEMGDLVLQLTRLTHAGGEASTSEPAEHDT